MPTARAWSRRSSGSAGWNRYRLAHILLFGANQSGLIDLVCSMNRFVRSNTHVLKRRGGPCESTEFSEFLRWLVLHRRSRAEVPPLPKSIAEPCSSRWPAPLTCSGYAGLRSLTKIGLWLVCRRTPRSSARRADRCLNQATAPLILRRRRIRHNRWRLRFDAVTSTNKICALRLFGSRRSDPSQQTSTHSAATSSAIRDGAILTAL
jgi:hypothetical protein